MSEPIRSKNGDMSKAPTPQNTPSLVVNSYLRSQPPTVLTIKEEGEDSGATGLGELANNPALLSMIQGKLGTLVGQQTDYVDNLPKKVKQRVHGLKAVQQRQMKLEAEFQKELLELEKKYFKEYEPLYERRRKLVNGFEEPTAEEIEEGEALKEDISEDEDEEDEEEEEVEEEESTETGIPNFWLTAMENLSTISEMITDRDAEVLEYLADIRMEYLSTPGFELIFEFRENPFFSNQILTKTYHYQVELGYSGDFVYDQADGCEINWKTKENNVTMSIERRKQRNRNTKQTRTIEKLTPTESFFNFFDPPKPPKRDSEDEEGKGLDELSGENSEDEEEEADLELRLELDYQLGEEIKDRLIPRAIDWFTGDAVEFEGYPEEDEEDEEEDDDEEDTDGSGDEDGDAPKQNPPECKQQ